MAILADASAASLHPFVTDNGNYIYDCRFKSIADPAALQLKLRERAGIVESGLFVGLAAMAFVADANGVKKMQK